MTLNAQDLMHEGIRLNAKARRTHYNLHNKTPAMDADGGFLVHLETINHPVKDGTDGESWGKNDESREDDQIPGQADPFFYFSPNRIDDRVFAVYGIENPEGDSFGSENSCQDQDMPAIVDYLNIDPANPGQKNGFTDPSGKAMETQGNDANSSLVMKGVHGIDGEIPAILLASSYEMKKDTVPSGKNFVSSNSDNVLQDLVSKGNTSGLNPGNSGMSKNGIDPEPDLEAGPGNSFNETSTDKHAQGEKATVKGLTLGTTDEYVPEDMLRKAPTTTNQNSLLDLQMGTGVRLSLTPKDYADSEYSTGEPDTQSPEEQNFQGDSGGSRKNSSVSEGINVTEESFLPEKNYSDENSSTAFRYSELISSNNIAEGKNIKQAQLISGPGNMAMREEIQFHETDQIQIRTSWHPESRDGPISRLILELSPARLGRIDVEINRRGDGGMDAMLLFSQTDTMDLFKKDQNELQHVIADALGMDPASMNFSMDHFGSRYAETFGYHEEKISGKRAGENNRDANIGEKKRVVLQTDLQRILDQLV